MTDAITRIDHSKEAIDAVNSGLVTAIETPFVKLAEHDTTPSTPISISSASTSSATASRISLRPSLPPPTGPSEMYLINSLEQFSITNRRIIENYNTKTKNILDEVERLHKIQIKVLEEKAKDISSLQTWSSLQNVSTYVSSTSSLVLGMSLLTGGTTTVAASLLIAGGGLNLFNRMAADTGLYEKVSGYFKDSTKAKKDLAKDFENVISLVSLGLGVFGAVSGFWVKDGISLALKPMSTLIDKVAHITFITSNIASATATYQRSRVDKIIHDHEAIILEGQGTEIKHSNILRQLASSLSDELEDQTSRIEKLKRILQEYQQKAVNIS
jgi:hypothetical protein